MPRIYLTLDTKARHFDEKAKRQFRNALASFLGISSRRLRVTREGKGSVKVAIDLPAESERELLAAYGRRDCEFLTKLAPFVILDAQLRGKPIQPESTGRPGRALECWSAQALRQIGATKVEQDVDIDGNQVDILAELPIAGFSHCIIVEVKDTSRPVGVHIVNRFASIFRLVRDARPMVHEAVIVSRGGFTAPAREAARAHGIRLLEPGDLDAMMPAAARRERIIRHLALALADMCGLMLVPVSEGDGWQLGVDGKADSDLPPAGSASSGGHDT